MTTKSEDSQNPKEPAKTDEVQSLADGPTFSRFLPPNPTKEQWEDFGRYPWFYNWMEVYATTPKPTTYAVYCDQPPELQAGTDSGSAADATSPSSNNAVGDLPDADEPPSENINKSASDN